MTSGLGGVRAITFDFGNTLVPIRREGLRQVVRLTAERLASRSGPFRVEAFVTAWAEERDRQFREEVPRFREVDLEQRLVRVLARLRGLSPPPADAAWDDAEAGRRSSRDEITAGVEVYSTAFVEVVPVPPDVAPVLEALARQHRLGILSNWPLAATVDRFVEAAGWDRWIGPIVVSQRVGTIKPQRRIFEAAQGALGGLSAEHILHVGDDWAADVVGAREAGWRAGWLSARPADSPLPGSARDERVVADLEIAALGDLLDAVGGGS